MHPTSTPVCSPPATKTAASLSAPAAGRGVCNRGPSALAFINDYTARNTGAWLSIADFLARQNLREVLASRAAADGKRSAAAAARAAINFGGGVAPCTASVPDGNHGDNFSPASSQVLA